MFWAAKIMLVNKTTVPASMHGYGIAAVNNDNSVILHGKLIANFGSMYAATHESVKSHSLRIVLMQGQLRAMQQICMALQQQQPSETRFSSIVNINIIAGYLITIQ
jgi:hypothetical protein